MAERVRKLEISAGLKSFSLRKKGPGDFGLSGNERRCQRNSKWKVNLQQKLFQSPLKDSTWGVKRTKCAVEKTEGWLRLQRGGKFKGERKKMPWILEGHRVHFPRLCALKTLSAN